MRCGYLLRKGVITTIVFPGAIDTRAWGINPSGQIVGLYLDAQGKQHGFLRNP
jgi:uncharacterized membrane protein